MHKAHFDECDWDQGYRYQSTLKWYISGSLVTSLSCHKMHPIYRVDVKVPRTLTLIFHQTLMVSHAWKRYRWYVFGWHATVEPSLIALITYPMWTRANTFTVIVIRNNIFGDLACIICLQCSQSCLPRHLNETKAMNWEIHYSFSETGFYWLNILHWKLNIAVAVNFWFQLIL